MRVAQRKTRCVESEKVVDTAEDRALGFEAGDVDFLMSEFGREKLGKQKD